jgi:hypothetical protein
MEESNFERMIAIIDSVFDTRQDPDQLQVTEEDIARLQALHPSTLAEYNEGNGPCVWILTIPTTRNIMEQFLSGEISENRLLQLTQPGTKFETVYLCSATVLPEYRKKGLATKMTLDAIADMEKENPIEALFVWPFTPEGRVLAQKIADKAGLPLYIREH